VSAKPKPDCSAHVEPATGFGPMRGWRWVCLCGRRGTAKATREQVNASLERHLARRQHT
jgi:hypothetical protein